MNLLKIVLVLFSTSVFGVPLTSCPQTLIELASSAERVEAIKDRAVYSFQVTVGKGETAKTYHVASIEFADRKLSSKQKLRYEKQLEEVVSFLEMYIRGEFNRVGGVLNLVEIPFTQIILNDYGYVGGYLLHGLEKIRPIKSLLNAVPFGVYQPKAQDKLFINFKGKALKSQVINQRVSEWEQLSRWQRIINGGAKLLERMKEKRLQKFRELKEKYGEKLMVFGQKIAEVIEKKLRNSKNKALTIEFLNGLIRINYNSGVNAKMAEEVSLLREMVKQIPAENFRSGLADLAKRLKDRQFQERVLADVANHAMRIELDTSTTAIYDQKIIGSIVVQVAGAANVKYETGAFYENFVNTKTTSQSERKKGFYAKFSQWIWFSIVVNEFDNVNVRVVNFQPEALLSKGIREMHADALQSQERSKSGNSGVQDG